MVILNLFVYMKIEFYTGIVVTWVLDANAPTVEEIGIDSKISEYNAVNYEKLQYTSVNDGTMGWGFEESIASEATNICWTLMK